MATGDIVAKIEEVLQPVSGSAEIGVFQVTTPTPDVGLRCIDFSSSANESIIYKCRMLKVYSGSIGVKVRIEWVGNATSGSVEWEVSFLRLNEDADLDTKTFAAVQTVTTATDTGSANKVNISEITFTDGSQMDSVAAGDLFLLSILRDQTIGSDMAVDARLLSISVVET